MKQDKKLIILSFIGNYLPGYKAGGIIRNIANTTDHLCGVFEYLIVTKDRDLGDDLPYVDIKPNKWLSFKNTSIRYLTPNKLGFFSIVKLINKTNHDVIFLNGFFDLFAIKVLIYRFLSFRKFKPVIVAPYGEFAWASLSQKYPKKRFFIKFVKILGLYNNVIWRASSIYERDDIIKVMNVNNNDIHITGDLPPINSNMDFSKIISNYEPSDEYLKITFLSRISKEKNLDYAIKILAKVKSRIIFDIYGPTENKDYWNECRSLISSLPNNIEVNYKGNVKGELVLDIFSRYDLFLFPTGGEAYGNVIAESLTVGTPVLISTETPWRNLKDDGLGWDVNLNELDTFVEIIESFKRLTIEQKINFRKNVRNKIVEKINDPFVLQSNIDLINNSVIRK